MLEKSRHMVGGRKMAVGLDEASVSDGAQALRNAARTAAPREIFRGAAVLVWRLD